MVRASGCARALAPRKRKKKKKKNTWLPLVFVLGRRVVAFSSLFGSKKTILLTLDSYEAFFGFDDDALIFDI